MSDAAAAPKGRLSGLQVFALFLLRVTVGWHFLYEGLAKLYTPGWSSKQYLDLSRWIFAPYFHQLAADPELLRIVDLANVWGLIAIGAALMLGFLSRLAAFFGGVLLLLYYAAHPALPGLGFGVPVEGHYLIVNKNLVELAALLGLLIFPAGRCLGLDGVFHALLGRRPKPQADEGTAYSSYATEPSPAVAAGPPSRGRLARRHFLGSLATVPFLGGFALAVQRKWGWKSFEEKQLKDQLDAVSSATIKTFDFSTLDDLEGQMPHAPIRDVMFSRMILGGNLIGGWAHARDLIYVSKLVKAYHHRDKIFETFLLAERCGVNTILTNPILCDVINEYWRRKIGKIQFVSDCGGRDLIKMVQKSIDGGAAACYVQGGTADALVRKDQIDQIARALELIRRNNLPAGIGAHSIKTVKACVDYGLTPDFWMKTLHHHNYWSAKLEGRCDNLFCEDPAETIAYMKTRAEPWIAFKILAAGAIRPSEGFPYAFRNGADFICVGMYDFQIVEDVNLALKVLAGDLKRDRPWRA